MHWPTFWSRTAAIIAELLRLKVCQWLTLRVARFRGSITSTNLPVLPNFIWIRESQWGFTFWWPNSRQCKVKSDAIVNFVGSQWLFRLPKSKIPPLSAAPHSHCSRTTPITPNGLLFAFAAEKPRTGEFRFALCALNDMIPQLLRVDRSSFHFGVANKAFLLFPSIFAERRSTFCLNLESKLKQSYIRIHSSATNTGNCKLFSAFTWSENKAVCGDKPERWI